MALDNFVSTAEAQVGNGGSTYTTWYGVPSTTSWCVIFVSWCADQAGIRTTASTASYPYVYGNTASSSALLTWYTNNRRDLTPSMNTSSNNYPMVGDIIFVENNNNSSDGPDHVGIIKAVSGNTVTTIEGNLGSPGIVKQKTYTDLVCDDGTGATIMMLGSNHKSY